MSSAFTDPVGLFDLAGKTALITGSGGGIGLSLARGLGAAGARIVLNGRDAAKLSKAAGILEEAGVDHTSCAFDVSDDTAVEAAIEQIERDDGPIDILVNNAGTNRRGAMGDISADDYRMVMNANVDGLFFVTRSVAPYMEVRGRGKIINICSALSKLGRKGAVAYSGSKGAAAIMTASMCDELAPKGIQVNGIAPGYFLTEITEVIAQDEAHNTWLINRTPAGRWGEMQDLVGAAIFLASPASDFVNGHILAVDGGLTAVIGG
ncbi:SDR family oxidoreductase [Pelagibius litoralis]|uniref:SDR family oxidoreductase n=1 Tax=Pelagibius litoralis TaxID=374515 RepID=A0A967KDA6_9PROT|nr:SDR family NAD(P)-dependent oxidoreductase [Pelagibius litoralis]NIA71309.1 SDR family oxidoreductase [Pelagibius litoralis]